MKSAYAYITRDKFSPTNRTREVEMMWPKSDPSKPDVVHKVPRRSRVSTEQVIPSRKGSYSTDQTNVSILNKEVLNEDINTRVLLLPPPGNGNAWEKSIIHILSHSGSVIVQVIRLPGAVNHHFRMYVTSSEESVRVVLPPKFRGGIYINDIRSMPKVEYSVELRKAIDGEAVRVNPMYVGDDEDEVHIDSQKNIDIDMVVVAEELERPPVWVPEGKMSRLRHMLR